MFSALFQTYSLMHLKSNTRRCKNCEHLFLK